MYRSLHPSFDPNPQLRLNFSLEIKKALIDNVQKKKEGSLSEPSLIYLLKLGEARTSRLAKRLLSRLLASAGTAPRKVVASCVVVES